MQEKDQEYLSAGTGIAISNSDYAPNVAVVGNPTIDSDLVCSGFSDADYLSITNHIKGIQTSFEYVTAINLNETAAGKAALGILDSTQEYLPLLDAYTGISIRLTTYSNGSVRLRVSNTGDINYIADIQGSTVLAINTKYWVKVTYNTTAGYALYTSLDGSTWTSEGTSAATGLPYSGTKKFLIGDNAASGSSFPGSIYLKDTYLSVDGVVVWKGVKPIGTTVISTDALRNTATGTDSLKVGGVEQIFTGDYATVFGVNSEADDYSTSVGYNNYSANGSVAVGTSVAAYNCTIGVGIGNNIAVDGDYSIAIGNGCTTSALGAIQIGPGTNNTAGTFSVGLRTASNVSNNYQLLDSSGNIPAARLSSIYEVVQTLPVSPTAGKIYFVTGSTT